MTIRLEVLGRLRIYQADEENPTLPTQPVRCALLVYLAVEGGAPRDELATVLWADAGSKAARHSLSQTLYELRGDLGDEWVRSQGQRVEVTRSVQVDATRFVEAVSDGDHALALSLYAGPFLDGVHLAETREFEEWADRQRSRLGRLHRVARRARVGELRAAGDRNAALESARRWVELEPLDDEAHDALIRVLAESGMRSEALRHYASYAELMEGELGVEPLEETRELVDRLRAGEFDPEEEAPAGGTASASPRDPRTRAADGDSEPGAAAPPKNSVAVLPFLNLSSDTEGVYFTDGVTEEIIARLARLEDLRVISRTSVMRYRGSEKSLREIGRELGVATILEGSVRRADGRVRIAAKLVDARTDETLMSQTYDREIEDIFEIQSEVAEGIARALDREISPSDRAAAVHRRSSDMRAYRLYLNGRFLWNRRTEADLARSVELLGEAVELDPEFVLAHAALADAHVIRGLYGLVHPGDAMPRAREAASRALALQDSLGEPWAALGCVEAMYDRAWEDAEAHFRHAIELAPGYPTARQWYAINCLAPRGRFTEAHGEVLEARRLDPLSMAIGTTSAILRFFEGDPAQAVRELRDVLALEEGFGLARYFLGQVHLAEGRLEPAIEELRRAVEASGSSAETRAALGQALALAGNEQEALEVLDALEIQAQGSYVSPVRLAQVQAALGRRREAVANIREAVAIRTPDLIWLTVNPVFAELRDVAADAGVLEPDVA